MHLTNQGTIVPFNILILFDSRGHASENIEEEREGERESTAVQAHVSARV